MILIDRLGQSVCWAWAEEPINGMAEAAAALPMK
jgi:hypothetical protein